MEEKVGYLHPNLIKFSIEFPLGWRSKQDFWIWRQRQISNSIGSTCLVILALQWRHLSVSCQFYYTKSDYFGNENASLLFSKTLRLRDYIDWCRPVVNF